MGVLSELHQAHRSGLRLRRVRVQGAHPANITVGTSLGHALRCQSSDVPTRPGSVAVHIDSELGVSCFGMVLLRSFSSLSAFVPKVGAL